MDAVSGQVRMKMEKGLLEGIQRRVVWSLIEKGRRKEECAMLASL